MGEDRDSTGPVGGPETARLIQKVGEELDRGRGVEAVRLFAEGLDQGINPPGKSLVGWLVKVLGKSGTAKLIDAYARHPCFYCKKGLEQCESCKGLGHWQDNTLCEACVSTGMARCDFCDVTGLVTFNAIPADLRLLVARERVRLAAAGVKALVGRAAPQPSASQPHERLKQCARRLLDVNRLMGVFENAVILVGSVLTAETDSRSIQLKILQACARFAPVARERIREILRCMSACARYEVKNPKLAQADHDLAQKRAAFLEVMLDPSSKFAGTALEHPFLFSKLDELTQRPAAKDDPQPQPAPKEP